MKIKELVKQIADDGLDAYGPLSVGHLDRLPDCLSLVKEKRTYAIYSCNERGLVIPLESGLDESTACLKFLEHINRKKNIYLYNQKLKASNNGL